ncbi:hypothetical protein [Saccharicrinis fermentans]|uniref:HEPN domain-containing protein n=1 Tax=Saccharicrinis fermentans DSM 9555 = JCM 21142 TaxID=869213 RepID=W7Y945_9BACT|nr:hypothetical protein [Saccharicrinis fermentans]GAF04822.1 hypothetical protein JCM21142_93542 [Saccharicrinis fermentans DSM 9555 = JCM 21142]
MENSQRFYQTGTEYYQNAMDLSGSNQQPSLITYNLISMSAEFLMSAILYENGIEPYKTGKDILATLIKNSLIPEKIKIKAIHLKKQCDYKKNTATLQIHHIVDLCKWLQDIKSWVDTQLKSAISI